MKKTHQRPGEVRVTGVPAEIRNGLEVIAKNIGISISNYLRPKLREIYDNENQHLKTRRNFDDEDLD